LSKKYRRRKRQQKNRDGEMQNNADDEMQKNVNNERYKTYVKERDNALEAKLKVSERFEKTIFLISGGALGLSLTFIKDVVPAPFFLPYFLYLAWSFLAISLCLCLVSLYCSLEAFHKKVENLDKAERQQQYNLNSQLVQTGQSSVPYGNVIDRLNLIAVICLCVGIIALIVFTIINTAFNLHDAEPHLSDTQVAIPNVIEQNENIENGF